MIEINEFCSFADDAFSTLLEAYHMKNWGVSWQFFVQRAAVEFTIKANEWLNEEV